jgi:hypothetical protein
VEFEKEFMQAFKERKKSYYYMARTKKLLHSFYLRLKKVLKNLKNSCKESSAVPPPPRISNGALPNGLLNIV